MKSPESRMTGGSINKGVVEEIQDYDNITIREMLEKGGLAEQGDVITVDDYEATRKRAAVLAQESKNPVSAKTLLLAAFVDRMRVVRQVGDEEIKKIPNEALRSIVYVDSGYNPSDEELEMLRRSPLGLKEWEGGRMATKEGNKEFNVAVDEDTVVARGSSPEEAMRRVRDERA